MDERGTRHNTTQPEWAQQLGASAMIMLHETWIKGLAQEAPSLRLPTPAWASFAAKHHVGLQLPPEAHE